MRTTLLIVFAILPLLVFSSCAKIKDDLTKNWSVQKLYNEARTARLKKDYEVAVRYYGLIEARYPYGRYAEQSLLELAYTYYKNEDPQLAIATADRFIRLYPTHPHVDYALYIKGLTDFTGKETFIDRIFSGGVKISERDPSASQRSFAAFKELVTRFPKSKYATDARQRMTFLHNALAKYEINVAEFYYIRGAYVATVNRSKYVLNNYQRTPSMEDALGLQALSYKQMGMTKLMLNNIRVLRKNFPKSRYLEKIDKLVVTGKRPKKI